MKITLGAVTGNAEHDRAILAGQADSIPEACGVNTDSDYLDTGNSNANQIGCKRSTLAFLRSIPFSVDNMSISMDFEKAQCFYPGKFIRIYNFSLNGPYKLITISINRPL